MGLNLASLLTASAARRPDAPAVRLGERTLRYAELERLAGAMAALLRERGLRRDDRVGLMLPNVPEFPIAYFGALRAGGIVVPMNVMLKRREVAYHLEDSGARLLLAWHELDEEAAAGTAAAGAELLAVEPRGLAALIAERAAAASEPPAPTAGDDTAVILYTSGTTGRPKGAELTHANLHGNAEVVARTVSRVGPGDVVLGTLPLFHSFGQTVSMNATLLAGACLTLVPRFEPGEALATIERDRVTHFYGVPTMYGALLRHPGRERRDTSSLRLCISGGASLPVEVLRGFERAFGAPVLEGYGLSETSPVACHNHPGRERRPGSVGTPLEGVEVRVADESGTELPPGEVGEILIRGPNVMKGYWRRPEATAEALRDGWLRTGDLATRDEDGYLRIVDRKKDMILRGGYNVYPREVEEVLFEHPAVREAAVVGLPDARLGEEVGAAVVLRPGERVAAEEVSAFARERIAAYKYPRRVWFVDELPKGPTGKVLRREISPP